MARVSNNEISNPCKPQTQASDCSKGRILKCASMVVNTEAPLTCVFSEKFERSILSEESYIKGGGAKIAYFQCFRQRMNLGSALRPSIKNYYLIGTISHPRTAFKAHVHDWMDYLNHTKLL